MNRKERQVSAETRIDVVILHILSLCCLEEEEKREEEKDPFILLNLGARKKGETSFHFRMMMKRRSDRIFS